MLNYIIVITKIHCIIKITSLCPPKTKYGLGPPHVAYMQVHYNIQPPHVVCVTT